MKKYLFALAALLIIVLIFTYALFFHKSSHPEQAHGMVDLQDSLLSFERPGRLIQLYADEGQQVQADELLAQLDTRNLQHQISIQEAKCHAEQALLRQYQNGYLPEEIARAQAVLARAQASVEMAQITFERNQSLLKTNSISAQEYDKAAATFHEAEAQRNEAAAALALMQKGYREEMIQAQAAKVKACTALVDYLHYQNEEQGQIRAPFAGTIRMRTHEISDFVQAGEPIFALTDEDQKRIRIYLCRDQLVLIKLDQEVTVKVAQSTLPGRISFISPQAMFTPKTVQTEELRADLVYEVTVDVIDSSHILRFGEAVTVILRDPSLAQSAATTATVAP